MEKALQQLADRGVITLPRNPGKTPSVLPADRRRLADSLGEAVEKTASEIIIEDRG